MALDTCKHHQIRPQGSSEPLLALESNWLPTLVKFSGIGSLALWSSLRKATEPKPKKSTWLLGRSCSPQSCLGYIQTCWHFLIYQSIKQYSVMQHCRASRRVLEKRGKSRQSSAEANHFLLRYIKLQAEGRRRKRKLKVPNRGVNFSYINFTWSQNKEVEDSAVRYSSTPDSNHLGGL